MKRIAFLSIFMLLCTLVATVYAAPPVIEHFESDETFPLIDCGMVGVGDYWIYDHSVGDITLKTILRYCQMLWTTESRMASAGELTTESDGMSGRMRVSPSGNWIPA